MEKSAKAYDNKNAIERLKMSLEQRCPVIVLGAGFSCGARTPKGDKLPLAAELTEKLFNDCFRDCRLSTELKEDRKDAMSFVISAFKFYLSGIIN